MHSVRLQAAQRRALDVINSIGLSDSLLRVIDRRQRMDRWIVYGGMVRSFLCHVAVANATSQSLS